MILTKLAIVLILQTAQSSSNALLPIERYDEREIADCVSKIYKILQSPKTRLYNLLNETKFDFLDDISAIINDGSFEHGDIAANNYIAYDLMFNTGLIILMFDDSTYMGLTITFITSKLNSFLLCIYLGNENIMGIFDTVIYQYMNMRVILIDRNAYGYTMNLYEEHCGRNESAVLIFHCGNLNVDEVLRVNENHQVKDLKGCPMYAQFVKNGIAFTDRTMHLNQSSLGKTQYKLLQEVSKSLNSSLVLNTNYYNPNKYSIYFGEVHFKDVFDLSPQFSDQYVLAVPFGKNYPKWHGLLYVFDWKLWLSIFCCAGIITIITYAVAQFAMQPEKYNEIAHTVMTFYCMLLGQGVSEPKYVILRIIFIVWLFFCLIILNAYNGLFLTHLLHPLSEKTLNSIEDVFEDGFVVHATTGTLQDMKFVAEIFGNEKYRENLLYGHKHDIVEWSFDDQKVALLLKQSEADFIMAEFKDEVLPFHTIPLTTVFICFQTYTIGHPYKHEVMSRIIYLNEMGLITKWMVDFQNAGQIWAKNDFEALTLEHFGLAFYILFAGITLAIIAFVYEHYNFKYKNTRVFDKIKQFFN